ncbi:MAG: helix-turn-helix domain-containing protein [Myxococcota bacterium]|nr:helix-turn-helix domain-containing protein [Myxococcota bacterium]MEC8381549.1 helix-turn-helix domain-containing protein [Myxococcota bacterium]
MPKIVDHEQRRVEILNASFGAFAENGYAALSMRQLAKSIGVTTGSLYHYFQSKNALFEALFERLQEEDLRAAAQTFSNQVSKRERAQALVAFLNDRSDRLCKALLIAVEYHRVQPKDDSQQIIEDTIEGYRQALKDNLNTDSDALAELLLSVIFGILIQGALAPEISDLKSQLMILQALTLQVLS